VVGGEVDQELVFRFSPLSALALLDDASDQASDDINEGAEPRWGVSAWLGVPGPAESIEDCAERLLGASGTRLTGKWMAVMPRGEVEAVGYPVVATEPPPHHCLIMLKSDAELADVAALERLANSMKRRNPMGIGRRQ
jgi:hypothetical protein